MFADFGRSGSRRNNWPLGPQPPDPDWNIRLKLHVSFSADKSKGCSEGTPGRGCVTTAHRCRRGWTSAREPRSPCRAFPADRLASAAFGRLPATPSASHPALRGSQPPGRSRLWRWLRRSGGKGESTPRRQPALQRARSRSDNGCGRALVRRCGHRSAARNAQPSCAEHRPR